MSGPQSFWRTSQGLSALVMIGAVTYFLLIEHSTHLFQALPFLIILLCPLMHIFMHRGHNFNDGHEGPEKNGSEKKEYQRGLAEGRRQSRDRDDTVRRYF